MDCAQTSRRWSPTSIPAFTAVPADASPKASRSKVVRNGSARSASSTNCPAWYSPWGYWNTDGFGYHEFLQFAEDIGADALYVVNVGVSCSFRSGTNATPRRGSAWTDSGHARRDRVPAIGPTASRWGGQRAKNGHPQPFPLKYIEVGNEQQGARYGQRWCEVRRGDSRRYLAD